MNIQQIKKRSEIINEKIERVEELQSFISAANDCEYYELFGTESERKRDIEVYQSEINSLEWSIQEEIKNLNDLK